MADVTLAIKVDSGQAVSGAAEIRAELDALKAKFAEVTGETTRASQAVAQAWQRQGSLAQALAQETAKVTGATKSVKEATDDYSSSVAKLDYSLGLITRAERDFAIGVEQVQRALRDGSITATGAAERMEVLNRRFDENKQAAAQVGESHGRMGNIVQNAGYQLADIAIVADMGSRSFGQIGIQIGQFLGVLGPAGAMIGAAATLGGVLAQNLLDGADAADKAADAEKGYADALSRSNELTKNSVELQKLKAEATQKAAFASVTEQRIAAQNELMALGQERAELESKIDAQEKRLGEGHADLVLVRELEDVNKKFDQTWESLKKLEDESRIFRGLDAPSNGSKLWEQQNEDRIRVTEQIASQMEAREKASEQSAKDAAKAEKERSKEHQEQLREELRLLQMKMTAERSGSSGRVGAATDAAQFAQENFGAGSAEYKGADNSVKEAVRAWDAEQRQIAQQTASTKIQISKMEMQAERESLEEQRSLGQISADEKYEALRNLVNKEAELDRQAVVDAQANLEEGTLAYQQAEDKKLLIAEQAKTKLAQLDRQAAQERMAQVNMWTSPISQAMNGMVSGVIAGTNTMRQVVARFGQSVVLSYANMAAQAGMKWFNQHVIMSAWDRMFATQEVATTAAKEATKARIVASGQTAQTAATRTGAATRTTLSASEDPGFFARVGSMLARWLGFETAKTASTEVGAGLRSTAEGEATLAAIAAAKAQAAGMIPAYTEIAAMGAASAVAFIPIIGPELAVAAAAEMEAMGAAALAVASAEGGWGEVPFDGAPAVLHKQEMVLPAKYATPLRAMLESPLSSAMPQIAMAGAGLQMPSIMQDSGAASASGTVNNSDSKSIVSSPNISVNVSPQNGWGSKDAIMSSSNYIAQAIAKEVRNNNRHLRGLFR